MKTFASGQRRAIVWTRPPILSRHGPGAPETRTARLASVTYEVSKRPNAATLGGEVGKS